MVLQWQLLTTLSGEETLCVCGRGEGGGGGGEERERSMIYTSFFEYTIQSTFTILFLWSYNRIYDCRLEVVQVSKGHEDNIRDIVHIPELDQV